MRAQFGFIGSHPETLVVSGARNLSQTGPISRYRLFDGGGWYFGVEVEINGGGSGLIAHQIRCSSCDRVSMIVGEIQIGIAESPRSHGTPIHT
ncbi:MAG: hypothetical protein KCHDKBKB_02382 [Elusimicrobia bacterium]|nr:hypothetical protein [Elusimicrobiota bacterium]